MSLRAKRIDRGHDAGHVAASLASLYAAPEWALLTEVRSSTGSCDVLRYADAVAVNLWPSSGPQIHGIEVKVSRQDWIRELRHPEKSGPIKLFCAAWYVAVPAPWKRIVLGETELPDRWGLIEVDGSKASVVMAAAEREPEEPTAGFWRALVRAACTASQRLEAGPVAGDAPVSAVTRPRLSGTHVGLGCGHVAPRPGTKGEPPPVLRCIACELDHPTDLEVVEAAIADALPADLDRIADALQRRRGRAA